MNNKEYEFVDVEEVAEIIGKSLRTARWFVSNSYTTPSKIALDALRETSPDDRGNFKTVIKRIRGRGITGRYKWSVRRDFVEKYAELFQEHNERVQKRKRAEEQQKAERVALMQELERRKQEREVNREVSKNTTPQPAVQPKQRNNPLTEDEKINLVLKTTNEPTKEIMRALILELERKNRQFDAAEERAQAQLMTKDAHIQELLATNNQLVQQLTAQQQVYEEPTYEPEPTPEPEPEQQESYTMELPAPHHNPFVASANSVEHTPASLAFYNQNQPEQPDPFPAPPPPEYSQQPTPHHGLGIALWITLTALVVAVVLLTLAIGGIISF